mmetsp:Transcript_117982/g.338401  ORF Transcript_117982/g.338401 Transcript_117982/m.338401 type:complete len:112 (+) Transcript_117982:377-712(+)
MAKVASQYTGFEPRPLEVFEPGLEVEWMSGKDTDLLPDRIDRDSPALEPDSRSLAALACLDFEGLLLFGGLLKGSMSVSLPTIPTSNCSANVRNMFCTLCSWWRLESILLW